jgi:DNA-binding transcriptional ArsR family regulator
MKLDYDIAASLLSQLGNITRLKIVRELVRAGDAGKPVGEIRNVLDIPNSTLSHHLSHLKNVGLIRQERERTVLRCFVNYDHIDGIVSFLTEECCASEPTYIKTDINGQFFLSLLFYITGDIKL